MDRPQPKRVLLKLSGTAFAGSGGVGIDPAAVAAVAREIKTAVDSGVQIAIVNGGGNLFRYRQVQNSGLGRLSADSIGMLGTIMNGLALQDSLENIGVPATLYSSVAVATVVRPFVASEARADLAAGQVVIVSGGTGHPFFTTDTAAVLRALEVKATVVFKATDVDGVYDSNPKDNPKARLYSELSLAVALEKKLKVMDATSLALARENDLPVIVFNFSQPEAFRKALQGEKVGTLVYP
jgi:uridylate kinase